MYKLSHWQVVEITHKDGVITRHFAGYSYGEGRTSSAIVSFDEGTLCGTTASGNRYQLCGDPGWNMDAMHIFGRWRHVNDVDEKNWRTIDPKELGYVEETVEADAE